MQLNENASIKDRENMRRNKRARKKQKVIQINVGFTILKIIVIIIIISLITAQTVRTIIQAKTSTNEAETTEEEATYYYVESSDGVQVPVPVGYTASEIEGETGVNTGFVIYEGDIDWSEIIVDEDTSAASSSEESSSSSNESSTQDSETTTSSLSETDEGNNNTSSSLSDDSEDIEETNENTESSSSENEVLATSEEEITTASDGDYYLNEYYSEETASNIWDLQCSTNQWVWVSVSEEDLETIYGVDENGKYWGKLYDDYNTALNWTETDGIIGITSETSYREPSVTAQLNTYDADSYLGKYLNGITRYELLTEELEENFCKTIESIRKYGGFYIGRYETGNITYSSSIEFAEAVVQKNNTYINKATWYRSYEMCERLAGENMNVTTSMIWGSLWDYTLRWIYASEATISDGTTMTEEMIWSDSTSWGNYYGATFDCYIDYNTINTQEKYSTEMNATGITEYTKVNNIYDLAGNVAEYTLECMKTNFRVVRGGYYEQDGYTGPTGHRHGENANTSPTTTAASFGCRASLYLN